MYSRKVLILIFSLLCLFDSYGANSRSERAKRLRDKRLYQVEAFDHYDFNLCQKYSKDKEDYFLYNCNESRVISSPISSLETNQYRISKKIYSDHFLKDLKDYTLNSLKSNEDDINTLVKCFDSNSSECLQKLEDLKDYVKTNLPSYRKTIALANIYTQSGRGFRFYHVPRKISHESLDYDIPELSDSEFNQINKIKKEITYNITQDSLSQIDHNCISYDFEYRENICPRYISNKSRNELSKGIERVKDQYRAEYNKRTNTDNLISRLNLRGDESDQDILKELKNQLLESVEANREAYGKISKLDSDEDLIDLMKNKSAVQGFITNQGTSKASCDIAQSLFEEVKTDQLMTSLYLGGAAIVGGGVCLGSFGLGCAIGVGIAAEAADLYMQQSNLEDSRLSFSAGLGNVEDVESAESDRNLALGFVALGSVGNLARPTLKVAKSGLSSFKRSVDNYVEVRGTVHDLSELRNYRPNLFKNYSNSSELKKKYSEFSLTTPRVNRRWIDNANESNSSLYLDVENAALKRLNDSLGDKELVTSLTNLHKDILYDKINRLTKKYKGIEFEVYSDFKSLRFAFTPKDIPEDIRKSFLNDLNLTYKNANQEFANKVKSLDGIGEENVARWFEGGISSFADGAGQAAKRARTISRDISNLVSFDNIKAMVSADIDKIKYYSLSLKSGPLKEAKLVETLPNGKGHTLKLEVFETVRKSIDNHTTSDLDEVLSLSKSDISHLQASEILNSKEVRQSLKEKFGVTLTDAESAGVVRYIKELDGLTPGLRQESRVVASLDKASAGGFSGDITGMGARNIQQVAYDILDATDLDAEKVLHATRLGEQNITKKFNEIKDNFTTTVKSVFDERGVVYKSRCSGDDCVVIPARELKKSDELAIVDAFRKQDNPSQYRLSFIPPNIKADSRTLLSTHGELIEKELRKQLTGVASDRVSYEKLAKLTIGPRMPSSVNKGKVELYLGVSDNVSLSSREKSLINNAYKNAIKKVNSNLAKEGNTSSELLYESGSITYID